MWLVGASFVCGRCRLRGVTARCPKCAGDALALQGEPSADPELARRWSAHPAFVRGDSLLSPRSIRHSRALLRVSCAFAAACCLGAVVGPATHAGPHDSLLPMVLGGVVAGALFFPFTAAFFALYFFALAHFTRFVARLLSPLAALLPIGGARFSLVTTIFTVVSRPLLQQIEYVPLVPNAERAARATLAEPLTVYMVRDSLSFIERFDAWFARPPVLRGEDGAVRIEELAHGGIELALSAGTRTAGAPEPPPWARAPGREGVRSTREFPAGTPVLLESWPGFSLLRVG